MSSNPDRIAPKHIVWICLAIATLAAVVLLAIFAEGAHVEAVLAFAAGLLIPGSPLGGVTRRTAVAVAGSALLALALTGCGAGALAAHGRASTIIRVAVEGADALADTGGAVALAACTTEECTVNVERVTGAIDAAVAATVLAAQVYVSAVEVALVSGEDGDVLSALLVALVRVVGGWSRLVELLAEIGVELPALPPGVLGLVGGGT